MHCLKCGKDVEQGQVFCEDCQKNMNGFPIEPGTPVVIIPRAEPRSDKDPRRKRKGYADIVRTYRKLILSLSIALGVAVLIIAVLAGSLFYAMVRENTPSKTLPSTIGKNYTTVETGIRS